VYRPALPVPLIDYGLRDYGLSPTPWPEISYSPLAGLPELTIPEMDACLGLEPTPEAYVAHLVHVFRLVHNVLRDDGTLWVNIGDSYAANRGYRVPDSMWGDVGNNHGSVVANGLKPKDLMMIPARLAMALQADGWWLRSDIIWHKPNAMPESVTDRPTTEHEHIFLLSKSKQYYYDAEAIKMPLAEESWGRMNRKQQLIERTRTGTIGKQVSNGIDQSRGYAGLAEARNGKTGYDPTGRNKRTVWTIPTRGYSEAHFAVFPPDLIEPCVLAGASLTVCAECGAAWVRDIKRTASEYNEKEGTAQSLRCAGVISGGTDKVTLGKTHLVERIDRGLKPACDCNGDTFPGVVLDPFAGSGTTGMVAAKHGRRAILIELNEEYMKLQPDRTTVQMMLEV